MHYHSEHKWTQPYRTHGLLWEAIETVSMCDTIEQQDDIADTVLADSMLTSIGVKLNKD
jgi:hypothetical protein